MKPKELGMNKFMKENLLSAKQMVEQDNVYIYAKKALFNFYMLIRADLKKRWKSLGKKDHREAIVALRYLEGVVKNPAAHFSRIATQDAWNNRAVEYAQKKGLKNVADAFFIVHGPREVFIENVKNAVYLPELYHALYTLAGRAQNWEYDRTSNDAYIRGKAERYAEEIIKMAAKTQKLVDLQTANPFVRPFKQFVYNFQK